MSDKPLVSAIIPTHNRPDLVVRAVKTALNQSHANMEVIVVVDGPDDSTSKALADLSDSRIQVITLPHQQGACAATNAGVQAARGEWVAFLDDDDEWLPRKTELQLAAARSSTHRVPVVSCRIVARTPLHDYIWPSRLPAPEEPIDEYLFCRKSIFHARGLMATPTLFAKRGLLLQVPFRDGLKKHQDWDWLIRAARQDGVGFEFESSPMAVCYFDQALPGITNTVQDWRFSLSWIQEMRPYISSRAYASFVLYTVADQAARVASAREYWGLLIHSMRNGTPVLADVMVYASVRLFPRDMRPRLRFWFGMAQ